MSDAGPGSDNKRRAPSFGPPARAGAGVRDAVSVRHEAWYRAALALMPAVPYMSDGELAVLAFEARQMVGAAEDQLRARRGLDADQRCGGAVAGL
jgi:hypothetical protein